MRTARLVGPTADGTSVVLVTEDGEELQVALEPGATLPPAWPTAGPSTTPTAVRRPPRRRETPMDTPLSPRDIQTRIRAGESLEDLTAGAGPDAERIERFAAPVLAEREHLALTALGSSVRRRGESSGSRPLRSVVAERLQAQGVDADDVRWDAWKRDDHSWQVCADYELLGEPRHAEFRFDTQGRFSVAEDDESRWLAGERPSPVAASVDRDDELALIRATREPSVADEELIETLDELGEVLESLPPLALSVEELGELIAEDPESDEAGDADDLDAGGPDADGGSTDEPTLAAVRDEAAEPTIAVVRHLTSVTVEVDETVALADPAPGADDDGEAEPSSPEEVRSALDTLYDMLGGDGYAEDSPRVYTGLSDAAAVPVVDEHEFEPPAAVRFPAEPDAEEPEPAEEPQPTAEDAQPAAEADDDPAEDEAADPDAPRPAEDEVPEPLVPSPGASRKPGRRKRASVPSWDEIMFGGPKPG